jgi:hypothetical protein
MPRREERNEARSEEIPPPSRPTEKPQSEPVEAPADAYQPPKWQPPAPTVSERPVQSKPGWWNKRG